MEDVSAAAVARLSEPAPSAHAAPSPTTSPSAVGHRHVHVETKTTRIDIDTTVSASVATTAQAQFTKAMEDAGDGPPCDVCGTITVRNGTCHKCLNCGNSLGCS